MRQLVLLFMGCSLILLASSMRYARASETGALRSRSDTGRCLAFTTIRGDYRAALVSCDATSPTHAWVQVSGDALQLAGTDLCLTLNEPRHGVILAPCAASDAQAWWGPDDKGQVHPDLAPHTCLTVNADIAQTVSVIPCRNFPLQEWQFDVSGFASQVAQES